MADDGFGSGLWRNLQAVRIGKDGRVEAPVRANGRDGIVVGVDHLAASDASARTPESTDPSPGAYGGGSLACPDADRGRQGLLSGVETSRAEVDERPY